MGRVDDVISVSGHRLGTMEIESALVSHPAVAEAAVVGKPDELKGEEVVAFVTLEGTYSSSDALSKELKAHVVKEIERWRVQAKFDLARRYPKRDREKLCVGYCDRWQQVKKLREILRRWKIGQCWINCVRAAKQVFIA